MVKGYMGEILNVDLSKGRISEELLDEELCRKFLGGYGIGVKILYDRLKPGIDPLAPENQIGIMTGPFTGTQAPIGSRWMIFGKSPQTNTWGDSNCGGKFGPQIKFAGVDGIFLTGASKKPVYLFIEEGKYELRDAGHFWGRDCYETDDILKKELGNDIEVACIGPAGEKLSLMSAVMTDKARAAARSGFAAVMGSKKLKAVVVKGKMKVPIENRDRLMEVRKRIPDGEKGGYLGVLTRFGTAGIMAHHAYFGDAPTKSWVGSGLDDGDFPPRMAQKISDESVIAYEEKKYGCWSCPIRCGGVMKISEGKFALLESENYRGHKPEYETLGMLGSNLLNDNLESIIKLNEICNRYGLDTISLGGTLGFAMECYEKGLITREDTDGIELVWGDAESIVAMSEKIAKREGFGDVLADGAKVAAEKIGKGSEAFAVHIHGREVSAHDPKYVPGMITTYFADACPANHVQGMEDWWPFGWGGERLPILESFYQTQKWSTGETFPRWTYSGRGDIHRKASAYRHVVNAIGACHFSDDSYVYATAIPDLLNSLTGWNLSFDDLLEIGEGIATLRHVFNLREGKNFLAWEVHGRIVGEPPMEVGSLKGIKLDYRTMWKEYLEATGWDSATALPSRERLERLGLEYVMDDVEELRRVYVEKRTAKWS